MDKLLRVVDINTKYHRATCVGIHEGVLFFGLMIRRLRPNGQEDWCFYRSLPEEDYQRLTSLNQDSQVFSFLGLPNNSIYVNKVLADQLAMDIPGRFIGTCVKNPPDGGQWTNTGVLAYLDLFCDRVHELLEGNRSGSL